LRANNQINAMLAIGEELAATPFRDAQRVMREKLADLIDDPRFRAYNAARDGGTDFGLNPEFEEVLVRP
jgi:hypothetical protein